MKAIYSLVAAAMAFSAVSCVDDLDVNNIDPNVDTSATKESVLNKCYASIALAGQSGPDGDCDIDGLDGGTTGYVRQLINSQELTTDELICCWGDPGIPEFNYNRWNADHPMLQGFYYRLYFSITMCNHFLEKFSGEDAAMTAEVRLLRAMHYFYLMDGWGNVPFKDKVSNESGVQMSRADLFNYVESEILDCLGNLNDPQPKKSTDTGYGRVDKAAAWLLLARLYLNAEVYTGTAKVAEAAEYAKKVIDSAYKLNTTSYGHWSAYQALFMGDNGETDAADEFIFPVLQDGQTTASYGTSVFAMASTWKSDMRLIFAEGDTVNAGGNNTSQNWSGNRLRRNLVEKFFPNGNIPEGKTADLYMFTTGANDDRALFYGVDRTLDIDANDDFNKGYSTVKFNNFYATGGTAHDAKFADTDWPLMRKAEAYLIYAEATARQNGGFATADGLAALNQLRTRANASTLGSADLNTICDEWAREFYCEGYRRTTLIRFGKFGGNTGYTWQWKGGTFAGQNFDTNYNLFAIPTADLNANTNLVQNPGF